MIIALALCISGCMGTKKTVEATEKTTQTSKIEKEQETVKETNTNRAINETLGISLQTGDSLVNARIREALRNFNYSNKSGSNSTSVRFDEESMALFIASIIGATQDHKEVNSSRSVIETSFDRQADTYIKTKLRQLPWWFYVIVVLFLLPRLVNAIKFIYNPLSSFISKWKKKSLNNT